MTRVHQRIERFTKAQRATITDLTVEVEGGDAGHRWIPVGVVGAYAPGGRHPLPSTVLMTVAPARVAKCDRGNVAWLPIGSDQFDAVTNVRGF